MIGSRFSLDAAGLAALVFIATLTASPGFTAEIRVPADYPTIQAGIDAAAEGDVVLVADGTYTGAGNRDLDLGGKAITVRSENGPESCIIDCETSSRAFHFHSQEGPDSVVQGFTIENGYQHHGGGILVALSSPTISNCIITHNEAWDDQQGGGICCNNYAAPEISGCTVTENTADIGGGISCLNGSDARIAGCTVNNNHGGLGGGIYAENSSPTITGCEVNFNRGVWGAGICCENSSVKITGCTIRENDAENDPYGGGIYCKGPSPEIRENIISGNRSGPGQWGWSDGGGIYCIANTHGQITHNTITDNVCTDYYGGYGGGICCIGTLTVADNVITGNYAGSFGGGIHYYGDVTVRDNIIAGNEANDGGGGICGECDYDTTFVKGSEAGHIGWLKAIDNDRETTGRGRDDADEISNNLIFSNVAVTGGGLHVCADADVFNNLMIDNYGSNDPGGAVTVYGSEATLAGNTVGAVEVPSTAGLSIVSGASVSMRDTILWNGPAGDGFPVGLTGNSILHINHSDLQGGQASVNVESGSSLVWGPGMIDADPLFATGSEGDFFLSQIGAGQGADSPCVNAGSGQAADLGLDSKTTRTDDVMDGGIVDIGYHYDVPSAEPDTFITSEQEDELDSPVIVFTFTGEDDVDPPSALVFSYQMDDGDWSDYGSATRAEISGLEEGSHVFRVRARDTQGNVDPTPAEHAFQMNPWGGGADWHHLVTGPGPGPINPPLVRTAEAEWPAYGVMKYGVNVACGNLDGEGPDEVITGPGPGTVFGPHVRGWTMGGQPLAGASFLAYGTNKYGVIVSAGDIDGDGFDEIVTGAGPGPVFGPHVRGWNGDGGPFEPMGGVSFMAYGTSKWGVGVACGDIDGDGIDEIITGAGPGAVFGPHVRGWNHDGGSGTTPISGISFMAYGTYKWGVNVACGDIDGDGIDEMITGPGPGPTFSAHVRAWSYDGNEVSQVSGGSFLAYDGAQDYRFGAVVGAGDLDDDGTDEILTMPGPGPGNHAQGRAFALEGGDITLHDSWYYNYDSWMRYGGKIAGVTAETRRRTGGKGVPPLPRR